MAEYSSEIHRKYEELRGLGAELATLNGRDPKFLPRKRANTGDEDAPSGRRDSDRRISYEGGNFDRGLKRRRIIEDDHPPPPRRSDRYEEEEFPTYRRPTVESSVRMVIDTRSRDDALKAQSGKDGARNKRMFGNLLLGTLKQFQKQETPAAKVQTEKLKEVEEKLETGQRQEREKHLQEKKAVEMKLREKEMEIKRLKQKRAIQAKNESKIAHYKTLQNFIQTETKPPIFFLPARLTLRGMELLKQSARNLDTLIKERETEMQNELRELEELSDGEIGPSIRSAVKVVSTDSRAHLKRTETANDQMEYDDDEDMDDDDDEFDFGVRSSVVVKKAADEEGNEKEGEKDDENVKGKENGKSEKNGESEEVVKHEEDDGEEKVSEKKNGSSSPPSD